MFQIRVDMYEVQLGSAMLLQFNCDNDERVSVLADAGVSASSYSIDHVKKKLPVSLIMNNQGQLKIDLIIGTHYDKDHLSGLEPIILDETIEIGEAWLPPVANDTKIHTVDDWLDDTDLLANQFQEENGYEVLKQYLDKKDKICQETSELIEMATSEGIQQREFIENQSESININGVHSEAKFSTYLNQANTILQDKDCSHVPDTNIELNEKQLLKSFSTDWWRKFQFDWFANKSARIKGFPERWTFDTDLMGIDSHSLAYVQRSAAKDAINAAYLYKIVSALKIRNIPIRSRIIKDGTPRRFVWSSQKKRFEAIGARHSKNLPELTLLGPSEGLVKKHWHRLPIGSYLAKLASFDIPIKSITPSNQLSYVVRFEYLKQGILVVGDSGFVDFKSGQRKKYFSELIEALLPLQVVQVAHHGGRNGHFYRALLEAGYQKQLQKSYLLLSHETDDQYRPSNEFNLFVEQLRKDEENVSILFTSKPKLKKVIDYLDLIHSVAPIGHSPQDQGDVCIEFKDSQGWKVKKHSIKV